jgi:hypothetical protein
MLASFSWLQTHNIMHQIMPLRALFSPVTSDRLTFTFDAFTFSAAARITRLNKYHTPRLHTERYRLRYRSKSTRSLILPSKSQRLPPRRRIRIKHRLLRQTRHPRPMSRLQTTIIVRSIMHRNPTNQKSALNSQPAHLPHHHQQQTKKTHLLSHNALVPAVQLNRTWISTFPSYTLNKYCKIASLSPSSSPTILFIIARLTNRLFQPVTGCTRTSGWLRSMYLGPELGSSRSR